MESTLSKIPVTSDPIALYQFAAPFGVQLWTVAIRIFQQYWRTPSYLYSKTLLCVAVVSSLHLRSFSIANLLGSVHRFFVLGLPHISSRNARPALLDIHASLHLRQLSSTNHAPFCHTASPLRSPGTPFKDLFVESLYPVKYPC